MSDFPPTMSDPTLTERVASILDAPEVQDTTAAQPAPRRGRRTMQDKLSPEEYAAYLQTPKGRANEAARQRRMAAAQGDATRPTRRDGASLGKAAGIAFAPSKDDIDKLAKNIQGIHMVVSLASGIPEFVIDEKESQSLAIAVCAVSAQYDLSIDGKTGALLQLFGAAAMVYTPRVFALRARLARERKAKSDPPGSDATH